MRRKPDCEILVRIIVRRSGTPGSSGIVHIAKQKDITCRIINKEEKTNMLLALKSNSLSHNASVDFSTYASPYLNNAWSPDRFELVSLQAHSKGVELRLRVAEYFGQGRVPFHLSNIAAAT
jgi:hypothetical protein